MHTAQQIGTATLLLPLVGALVLLPGVLPALALRRVFGGPSAGVVPLAFGVSIGVLAAITTVAYLASFGLAVVGWLFLVISLGMAAALARRRDWRSLRWEWEPWAIAGAACALTLVQGAWTTGDAPYHLAGVRSLLAFDRPLVTDPYFGLANAPLDAISGTWHTMLALVSRVTRLDIAVLWPAVTALAATVVVLAFWTLCREVSRSPAAASIATIGLAVVTFFADFRWLAYPGAVSRGVLFVAMYAAVRAFVAPGWVPAAALGTLGTAALTMHLGTAEAFLLGAAVLIVACAVAWVRRGLGDRGVRAGLASVGAGVALAAVAGGPQLVARVATISDLKLSTTGATPSGFELATRYFVPLTGFAFRRPEFLWGHPQFAAPSAVAATVVGVSGLVVFAVMAWRAVKRPTRSAWAALGLVALPVLLQTPLLGLVILGRSEYMLVRLLDVADAFVFVGFAWAISRRRVGRVPVRGVAIVALAAAILCALPAVASAYLPSVLGVPTVNPTIVDMRRRSFTNEWGAANIARLASVVDASYPRVGTDPSTGYHLLAFVPIALAAGHPVHTPYYVEAADGPQRRADMAVLLWPGTSLQRRLELVRRYGIGLVAISRGTGRYRDAVTAFEGESGAFEEVVVSDHFWVFRVRPGATDALTPAR